MMTRNIISLFCGLTLFLLLLGCVSIPQPVSGENPFIYPQSEFTDASLFTPWYIRDGFVVTNDIAAGFANGDGFDAEAYAFTLQIFEINSNELDRMLADPFMKTKNIPSVTFDGYYAPAKVIAKYYKKQFKQHGWHKVRDRFVIEEYNGGGDWIRVYGKDDALVRIHIMGAWNFYRDEKENMRSGSFSPRMIQFQFICIEPSGLLGNDYKKKLVELVLY
ncbi:MAG: hypothetical protein PF692_14545 [Kiritimatiellae bacterium]|jgi:hypothetical protein|nr:hypothetical protein [Kiritimatiellia bacterium]